MITIIIQPHVHYIHAHIPYIIAICHIPYCVLYILYIHTIYILYIYTRIIAGPRPTNYNNNIHQTKCNKLLQILCNKNNKTNKQNKKTK